VLPDYKGKETDIPCLAFREGPLGPWQWSGYSAGLHNMASVSMHRVKE